MAPILSIIICLIEASELNPTEPKLATHPAPSVEYSCEILPGPPDNKPQGIQEDIRGGVRCYHKVHPSLPAFRLLLTVDKIDNTPTKIDVYRGDNQTELQTLDTLDAGAPFIGAEFLAAEDINFDGYNDLRLLLWWGATSNRGYRYWLFDPATSRFVAHPDLIDIQQPYLDPTSKTFTTLYNGGHAGRLFVAQTFKFSDNGRLVMLREQRQDCDEATKKYIRTILALKDGKMQVVENKVSDDGDFEISDLTVYRDERN